MFDSSLTTLRLQPGDKFTSKWSGKTITVERWVGEGANGSVYLARFPDGPSHCALKIGNDAYALQSEINVLQSVGTGAPRLLLADDGETRGISFPFYLMTFVPGVPLGKLSLEAARARFHTCGLSLLQQLKSLHEAGWAFGDLKPDNVMVGQDGGTRLVDYGGATPFGQSIKQFTELYDRGFWKAGGRKAEASYDLFSFAVLMIEAAGYGPRLRMIAHEAHRGKAKDMSKLVEESEWLARYRLILIRMLRSGFANTEEAFQAWRESAAKPVLRIAPAAKEIWPAVWFAGALLSFTAVIWWIHGM